MVRRVGRDRDCNHCTIGADRRSTAYSYARTQWLAPKLTITPTGQHLLPPFFERRKRHAVLEDLDLVPAEAQEERAGLAEGEMLDHALEREEDSNGQ